MIDDLATRASMTVAAFLLLATGLAVLGLHEGDAVRDALEGLASHLAHQLDAVSAIGGEVSFLSHDPPFALPTTVAGSVYQIEFTARAIRVVAGTAVAARPLRIPVHPFVPLQDVYTTEDLALRDSAVLSIRSDQAFAIERTARWVDAEHPYLTFVHLPP